MDTTLGFGTCCGVPMGTRSGDVDPAALMHLIDELGMTSRQVCDLIYKGSGLKGISGVSHDMRDLEEAAAKGHERAELALEIFAHATRKYIAALATSLGDRVDAVVFTAGIGENGPEIRERICRGLGFMGVRIDPERNRVRGKEAVISPEDAPVKVMVVPTNEELMIALDTEAVVTASRAGHHRWGGTRPPPDDHGPGRRSRSTAGRARGTAGGWAAGGAGGSCFITTSIAFELRVRRRSPPPGAARPRGRHALVLDHPATVLGPNRQVRR